MRRRLLITGSLAALLTVFAFAGTALAADPTGANAGADAVEHAGFSLNLLWLVLGAVLVIFMQAGFALVETGFCRAKHAAHVVMTNFTIFGLGFIGFFICGYALMFGAVDITAYFGSGEALGTMWGFGAQGGIVSHNGFFLGGNGYDVAIMGFFLYQVAFMDTTATIPTGAMAERWSFKNFVLWGFFCGALFYPLYGAWVWGGGWLSQLGNSMGLGHGVVDFAGSGVVHAMGGVAALAGAIVLGPRIGKYGKDGKPRTIAGHHIPMAMLGTFILLFGWFGFNAASTFAASDMRFAVVAANTAIAGAFGSIAGLFTIWRKTGKPDPGMTANGMLAGLVAITAPCAFVQPWAAAVIGTVAAIIVVNAIGFIERRGIDDPVGAISVHGVGGILGVLFVGLFADGAYGAGLNGVDGGVKGLFYGDAGQLAAQAVAVGVLLTVMLGIAFAFFKLSNKITPIRSKEADEIAGLDMPEMGVLAYPEFALGEPAAVSNGNGTPAHERDLVLD